MVKVHQIYTHNSYRNFNYIIEYDNNKAIVIDPFDAGQILKFLEEKNLKLIHIINTHEHFDHTAGNDSLKSKTGAIILAHHNAKGKIHRVDRFLNKADKIELSDNSYLEVMDTPGHTFAHLCLKLVTENKVVAVFTGDTLFNAGVGNCHNGGEASVLGDTIREQFENLDDGVLVYPGHEYLENNCNFTLNYEKDNTFAREIIQEYHKLLKEGIYYVSTIGVEKKINLFLRCEKDSVKDSLKINDKNELFLKLRELRNSW